MSCPHFDFSVGTTVSRDCSRCDLGEGWHATALVTISSKVRRSWADRFHPSRRASSLFSLLERNRHDSELIVTS